MFIASCSSNKHSNLKIEYPENIELATLKIDITYQTGL
tara:strand:- start:573 stop:686 length:114 start_codon:yes stop_codon:yes gene_type:complete